LLLIIYNSSWCLKPTRAIIILKRDDELSSMFLL